MWPRCFSDIVEACAMCFAANSPTPEQSTMTEDPGTQNRRKRIQKIRKSLDCDALNLSTKIRWIIYLTTQNLWRIGKCFASP